MAAFLLNVACELCLRSLCKPLSVLPVAAGVALVLPEAGCEPQGVGDTRHLCCLLRQRKGETAERGSEDGKKTEGTVEV